MDLDQYTTGKIDEKRLKSYLSSYVRDAYCETLIIDGLFLDRNSIEKLLEMLGPEEWKFVKSLGIEWWYRDVNVCLHNDKGRRQKNSTVTIKNAILERVDENFIAELETKFPKLKGKIKVNLHYSTMKPNWKVFAEENGLYFDKEGKVKSESWCMGGTWGNCWGDSGTVSAEAPPASFVEFDSLLEKICPNITFLQYKGIYNDCVGTDDYGDSDYYGGSTTYGYYYFNVETLYNALRERGLI